LLTDRQTDKRGQTYLPPPLSKVIITYTCANITLYVLSKFHEELPSHSKQAESDSTCHQQSSESFRYVNMTTLLSRTARCYNASLL